MKKISVSAIISILLVAVLGLGVQATSLVPSVTVKEAPSIKTEETTLTDASGNAVTIKEGDIKILSTKSLPANPTTVEEKALVAAVDEIKKSATDKTTPFFKALESSITASPIKAADGTVIKPEEMSVRDVFDLTLSEDLLKALNEGGQFKVEFQTNFKQTDTVIVMHQNLATSEWKTVPSDKVVIKADGSLDVTFDSLCPIAILVRDSKTTAAGGTTGGTNAQTGDTDNTMLIVLTAAIFVVAAGVAFVVIRKKNQARSK